MTGASQCYMFFFRTEITVRGLLYSFSNPGSLSWIAKALYLKFPDHTKLRLVCSYFFGSGTIRSFLVASCGL